MIIIDIIGLPELQENIAALPDRLLNVLFNKSSSLTDLLKQKVGEKLSGEVLQSKTGTLLNSIASEVNEDGDSISSSIFVDGDVPYAAILEYGGTTKSHIIEATQAKALAFMSNGKQMFAKYVNHPGSVIPEYSYLRSSLADMNDDILDEMSGAIQDELNQS